MCAEVRVFPAGFERQPSTLEVECVFVLQGLGVCGSSYIRRENPADFSELCYSARRLLKMVSHLTQVECSFHKNCIISTHVLKAFGETPCRRSYGYIANSTVLFQSNRSLLKAGIVTGASEIAPSSVAKVHFADLDFLSTSLAH